MDQKVIDSLVEPAYEILNEVGIAKGGKVSKSYRAQISTFGSAIINGTLLSAVSFFSTQEGASVDRSKLMEAIKLIINKDNKDDKDDKDDKETLFEYVKKNTPDVGENRQLKAKIMYAAIALKLAMNLYQLSGEEPAE